jgi:hypothetical protein
MIKQETDENGVTYSFYDGDDIVEGITERIVYKNGRIKEFKKIGAGGYWTDYPLGKKKLNIPMKCPKCGRLMDWFDETEFLKTEQCDRCKRIEVMASDEIVKTNSEF